MKAKKAVAQNEEDKDSFLEEFKGNMPIFLKGNPTYPTPELGGKKQVEEKAFVYWAYDLFAKWKNK